MSKQLWAGNVSLLQPLKAGKPVSNTISKSSTQHSAACRSSAAPLGSCASLNACSALPVSRLGVRLTEGQAAREHAP